MFDLKRQIKIVTASLMFLSAWGCSDNNGPSEEKDIEETVRVSFMIPKEISFATVSTRDADDDAYPGNGEGVLSNLYLVAVQTRYVDSESGMDESLEGKERVVVTPLNVFDDSGIIENYDRYEASLYPGYYRFYVFANTDLYADAMYTASNTFTEQNIKDFVIYYEPSTPIRKGHIPMACMAENIQYSENGEIKPVGKNSDSTKNYAVHITHSDTPIVYADMSFLCAKVRYTILFDAILPTEGSSYEGISSGFGNQSIRFYVDDASENRPTASNLRKATYLYDQDLYNQKEPDKSLLDGTWILELNRYEWPENGDKYPSKPSQPLKPWTGTLDEWKSERQRAWQGVVYLPENNDDVAHTVLSFPFVLDTYAVGDEPYKDGTQKPENVKKITLFGANKNENHYDGDKYSDEYEDQGDEPQANNDGYDHGVERGRFYDVVARVINPDEWDLKVTVYSRVEDWHDIVQNVEDGSEYGKDNEMNLKSSVNNWQYEEFTYRW